MSDTIPRHFAQVRGEEVVVLGHNKGLNSCLIARINSLPQDEAADLRRIAMSTTAQNLDYLVPTLRVERHKSGSDWFTHLVTRLHRRDGSVMNLPLNQIDAMNDGQKAFFKGYGEAVEPTGGPSSRVGKETEFRTPIEDVQGRIVAEEAPVVQAAPANLAEAQAQGLVGTSPTPATDPEMARVAAQAAGGAPVASGQDQVNAAILEALKGINESLADIKKAQKPARRTTKKKTTKKKPAAKVAAAS